MKITNNDKATKIYYIEVDDKELELLCDAMDAKAHEELKIDCALIYKGFRSNTLEKIQEMAGKLHNAFMGTFK
jgi:hypothetical protein